MAVCQVGWFGADSMSGGFWRNGGHEGCQKVVLNSTFCGFAICLPGSGGKQVQSV